MRVAVIGGAGYAGGELLRLLAGHPDVTEWMATSRSQAGKVIGEVHPALRALTDQRFADLDPAAAAAGKDVVFLALEHGESSQQAEAIFAARPGLVIDLAADFRVSDVALYEQFYGPHRSPQLISRFRYGLADLEGTALRGAKAIAAPGCFATAAQLALRPLADIRGLAPSLFAVTGSSGAGAKPKPTTHHPVRAHNLFAYSVLGHRHEAEVLQNWRAWTGDPAAAVRLMTHSGPFVRGIHLTLHARAQHDGDLARAKEWYAKTYAGRPFVRLLDHAPELTHVVGTNEAQLHVAVSAEGREVQVMIVIDNLVKGAGGQGIQAMNLALGIDEARGLKGGGIFPC